MKRFLLFSFAIGFSASSLALGAQDPIAVSIDSLTNISGNGALEACGTAIHKDGVKPILLTLKHSDSYYTTLTAPNGKWCVVFKRWTYDGKIDVSATTLQNPGFLNFATYRVSESE